MVELAHILRLLEQSPLLRSEERAFWLKALPRMTEKQLVKLQDVLERLNAIPLQGLTSGIASLVTAALPALSK